MSFYWLHLKIPLPALYHVKWDYPSNHETVSDKTYVNDTTECLPHPWELPVSENKTNLYSFKSYIVCITPTRNDGLVTFLSLWSGMIAKWL